MLLHHRIDIGLALLEKEKQLTEVAVTFYCTTSHVLLAFLTLDVLVGT